MSEASRLLTILDGFSRECLSIVVARRLNSRAVLDVPAELFVIHGPPEHIRANPL